MSDQVVAPVRETCSQCLGTLLTLMSPDGVPPLLNILINLLSQNAWEVRHGSLLALKYLFAVRRVSGIQVPELDSTSKLTIDC